MEPPCFWTFNQAFQGAELCSWAQAVNALIKSIFQFDDVKVSEFGDRYDQLQSLKQNNEETDAQFIQHVVISVCMFPLSSARQNKIINW
jgi:hypothetical protein